VGCGRQITAGVRERNKRKWCSETCRVRSWVQSRPDILAATRKRAAERSRIATTLRNKNIECCMCGVLFSARHRRKYCGQVCVNRANSRGRRAKLRGVPTDLYTRIEVFRRSDGICGLCENPISLERSHPDPLSFSVDHIVPLALGGTDLLVNVQAAHLRCNLSKGARRAA
jgi:5-methylcytosine-specific restriction endonuclease McrA